VREEFPQDKGNGRGFQIKEVWLPSRRVLGKITKFLDELAVNVPHKELGNQAPFEVLFEPEGEQKLRRFLQENPLRPGKTAEAFIEDARLRRGHVRYVEAYEKSGGLLNFLLPDPREEDDEVWRNLYERYVAEESFSSEEEKQRRLEEVSVLWNYTPNPLFSMLTPAQVWAGPGPIEGELLTQFLEALNDKFGRPQVPFRSEGDAIIQSILFLRAWQNEPMPKVFFLSRFLLLREEREKILKRKETLLGYRRPVVLFHIMPELDEVAHLLVENMAEEYEADIVQQAVKLWRDFRQVFKRIGTSRATSWAAAVEYAINRVNSTETTQAAIAQKYRVSPATVSARFNDLEKALDLRPLDKRYSSLLLSSRNSW